jgi:cell division protein FtsZ
MTEMGKAMMGTGEAGGDDRALMAAQNAIQNPLLDEVSLKGAKAVLVNVTGGLDMTLLEVDEAANAISEQVDPEANIIFGAAFDPSLEGMIRVSVVATGMDGASIAAIEPKVERRALTAEPLRATVSVPTTEPMPEPVAQPEPLDVAARETAEQVDIFDLAQAELAETAPVAAREPAVVEPVAAEAADAPLFAEAPYEPRKPRGGFMSIFGGRKPGYGAEPVARTAPAPAPTPAPSRGGAQPAEALDAEPDTAEDLEIPSFLRRLAN